MKGLFLAAVMITAMVGQLAAQANYPGNTGALPLKDTAPTLGSSNPSWWGYPFRGWRAGRHGDSGFHDWGYASDPAYYAEEYAALPSIIVLIPQAVAPPPPEATPSPIRPETREYHWPSSGSDSSATAFSIVSKDGRVESATAAWVQEDALCYLTPDGSKGQMPLGSVDRQATHQRNAEKQLNLWLPAESSGDD